MLGQRVAILIDETRATGAYTVPFDAGQLPGGVYVYRLRANGYEAAKKLLLLK